MTLKYHGMIFLYLVSWDIVSLWKCISTLRDISIITMMMLSILIIPRYSYYDLYDLQYIFLMCREEITILQSDSFRHVFVIKSLVFSFAASYCSPDRKSCVNPDKATLSGGNVTDHRWQTTIDWQQYRSFHSIVVGPIPPYKRSRSHMKLDRSSGGQKINFITDDQWVHIFLTSEPRVSRIQRPRPLKMAERKLLILAVSETDARYSLRLTSLSELS
jgi:hypothetical protein